jgi:pyridoxine 4-dehydrogenase
MHILIFHGSSLPSPFFSFFAGLFSYGDVLTYGWGPSGGYDQNLNEKSVADALETMFKYFPKVFIDSAEHYGYTDGFSETILGDNFKEKVLPDRRDRVTYATKYFPVPWRHPWRYPDIVLESFNGSLERCKLGNIDIYQLHGPSHWGYWPKLQTICDALCRVYKTGKCQAIGVCNLSIDQTKYVWEYLKKEGVPMVSSQIEFSLVRMDPLTSGHIKWCLDHGVSSVPHYQSYLTL